MYYLVVTISSIVVYSKDSVHGTCGMYGVGM